LTFLMCHTSPCRAKCLNQQNPNENARLGRAGRGSYRKSRRAASSGRANF
jgi:hypothetical protein